MHIVTAGWPYLDIDAYAGIIAYAELLNIRGEAAVAVSTAPLNESIPKSVREWGGKLMREYSPSQEDSFVVVDLSDPAFFDRFVDPGRVVEVIDHHTGFEQHWQQKIGDGAHIEFIGAACTLVYEAWKRADMLHQISQTSARLLVCGILDNTLNFGAAITNSRDKVAYNDLLQYAHLSDDWTEAYFRECEQLITHDIETAIDNDTKSFQFEQLSSEETGFAQMVVWDGEVFLKKFDKLIRNYLSTGYKMWFMNIIDLKEGKSRFIVSDDQVGVWLKRVIKNNQPGDVVVSERLWLRKEVIKQAQSTI